MTMTTGKKRVLKWSQREDWASVLRHLLDGEINEAVITKTRQVDPGHLTDHNFEWLNLAVAAVTNQHQKNIPALLANRLASYYKSVVAFHATRSPSPEDFLKYGIKLSDKKALQEFARNFFGNSDALEEAISWLRAIGYENPDQAWICLSLTKGTCFQEHKHYLLKGGEYLANIAIRVGQVAKLRGIGKPMIVECLLPTSIIPQEFWQRVSQNMLEDYFSKLLHPADEQKRRTYCVQIPQPITHEYIRCVHELVEVGQAEHYEDNSFHLVKVWDGQAKF
jgi:hypothetical protein